MWTYGIVTRVWAGLRDCGGLPQTWYMTLLVRDAWHCYTNMREIERERNVTYSGCRPR